MLYGEWTKDAKCRGKWELFDAVTAVNGRDYYPHIEKARALCATCPVFDECKAAGEGEKSGVWAGEAK